MTLDAGLAPESTPRMPSKADAPAADPSPAVLLHGPLPWAPASHLDLGRESDFLPGLCLALAAREPGKVSSWQLCSRVGLRPCLVQHGNSSEDGLLMLGPDGMSIRRLRTRMPPRKVQTPSHLLDILGQGGCDVGPSLGARSPGYHGHSHGMV